MEATSTSETSISTYKIIRCRSLQDRSIKTHPKAHYVSSYCIECKNSQEAAVAQFISVRNEEILCMQRKEEEIEERKCFFLEINILSVHGCRQNIFEREKQPELMHKTLLQIPVRTILRTSL